MATKRYTPTLKIIVEENSTMNSGNLKIKRTNSQISGTESSSCKRCSPSQLNGPVENGTKNCDNCGDKRKGIEKWLESIPTHGPKNSENTKNLPLQIQKAQQSRKKSISPPKTKPPPPPVGIIPKSISSSKLAPVTKELGNCSALSTNISMSEMVRSKMRSPKLKPDNNSHQKDNFCSFANIGTDIYNNPKFLLTDSPANSQRSKISNISQKARVNKELCDKYSNYYFDKSEQCRYEDIIKNIKQMPDMVYEALTRDYSLQNYKKYNTSFYNIPTPDYDSTIEKSNKDIYNSCTQSSAPSVPTPDYSTLSLGRKYQPDSPVYRRKSPQYLIVDYETDSLERSSTNRKCSTSSLSSPSSNNSSEVSSQPSPSLSTALPLEEEVEVHHTIYDKVDGFRKDGNCSSREIEETPNSKEMEARIKYDTPYMGSMTIEVEHEPQSDFEIATDSDQYEPDTLDRKPKKHSFCDVQNLNAAWTEHLTKSQKFVNCHDDRVSYSSLENMNSLPDFTNSEKDCPNGNQLILRSANSFRSTISSRLVNVTEKQATLESKPLFGSLREIYQSKVLTNSRPILSSVNFSSTVFKNTTEQDASDQGKILTLEAKHSRRQRSFLKEQKFMPPDVIPPEKLIETTNNSKNLNGWNTDSFSGEDTIYETTSDHSERTEFTGVSDNHEQNSDIEEIKLRNSTKLLKETTYSAMTSVSPNSATESQVNNKLSNLRNDYSFNKYLNRKKIVESGSNRHASETETNKNSHQRNPSPTPTINQHSNGMRIAIGIRDRAKKNKDIKNAWKKIVSIATSKFSPNTSPTITPTHTLNPDVISADSMPTLIDDKFFTCLEIPSKPVKLNELDSGYLNIEDSLDIYNRRLFDPFNFRAKIDVKPLITEEDNISPSCNGGSETEEEHDDGALGEDMCESGAESIETHSVLYKHTRR